MPDNAKMNQLVAAVFEDCLQLDHADISPVLIIFDDFGQPIAQRLAAFCSDHSLNSLAAYYPYDSQRALRDTRETRLHGLIRESDVLIDVVSSADECTQFRVSIITEAATSRLKILHLPGVTEDILMRGSKGLNYAGLHKRCEHLAGLLQEASDVTVVSATKTGKRCELAFSVRNRPIHVCGGVAQRSEIMNLPTGEVYVAPLENTAEGTVALNGSGPDCVLHDNEVLLVFRAGRVDLGRSRFPDSHAARELRGKLERCISEEPETYRMCEFGIGMNTAIAALSGEVILDEKKAGTCHVALGNNTPFGGALRSGYHHDLIFTAESINLDSRPLSARLWRDGRPRRRRSDGVPKNPPSQ